MSSSSSSLGWEKTSWELPSLSIMTRLMLFFLMVSLFRGRSACNAAVGMTAALFVTVAVALVRLVTTGAGVAITVSEPSDASDPEREVGLGAVLLDCTGEGDFAAPLELRLVPLLRGGVLVAVSSS